MRRHWAQYELFGERNVWILKPGTNSRGSGIQCHNSLPEILHGCRNVPNRIVQKYIERPLLLSSGKKFDIRQWVLVTSFNPLQAFIFNDAYLRLCSLPFDISDLANRHRHLSNWAINKPDNNCRPQGSPLSRREADFGERKGGRKESGRRLSTSSQFFGR